MARGRPSPPCYPVNRFNDLQALSLGQRTITVPGSRLSSHILRFLARPIVNPITSSGVPEHCGFLILSVTIRRPSPQALGNCQLALSLSEREAPCKASVNIPLPCARRQRYSAHARRT